MTIQEELIGPDKDKATEAMEVLSGLSSYLGAGLGDEETTAEQFDKRIRWGIDNHTQSLVRLCADKIEALSRKPSTTWGEVKTAILAISAADTADNKDMHDDDCIISKGYPCNCASAAFTDPLPLAGSVAKVLREIKTWATHRCPCHEETPNPCPLCGASVENLEACKAVESIFPRSLLHDLNQVLATA